MAAHTGHGVHVKSLESHTRVDDDRTGHLPLHMYDNLIIMWANVTDKEDPETAHCHHTINGNNITD